MVSLRSRRKGRKVTHSSFGSCVAFTFCRVHFKGDTLSPFNFPRMVVHVMVMAAADIVCDLFQPPRTLLGIYTSRAGKGNALLDEIPKTMFVIIVLPGTVRNGSVLKELFTEEICGKKKRTLTVSWYKKKIMFLFPKSENINSSLVISFDCS